MNATIDCRETALLALELGLSPVPPSEDGSKKPLADLASDDGGHTWKPYSTIPATRQHVLGWYRGNRAGVGLACGYGGLVCFEFDCRDTYNEFLEIAVETGLGDLVNRIRSGYEEFTPSGGVHWLYRFDEPKGNTKLAARPDPTSPGKVETLIETRGAGGFVITAPSHGKVHPSGEPYKLGLGGLRTIVTLSADDEQSLWRLARTFDAMPELVQTNGSPAKSNGHANGTNGRRNDSGTRPGDDFNDRATWEEILEPHGWVNVFRRGDTAFWRRPGKDHGVSATTGHCRGLKVFSTSTQFSTDGTHTKLYAYALLNHGGDTSAATKALVQKGYGTWIDSQGEERQNPPVREERKRATRKRAQELSPDGTAPAPPAPVNGTSEIKKADVNEADDDPHRLAWIYLKKFRHQGESTLRFYRGECFEWSAGAYRVVSEPEMLAGVNQTIKTEFDRINQIAVKIWELNGGFDKNGKACEKPVARKVTIPLVSNVVRAIQSLSVLSGKSEAPFWIDASGPFHPTEVMPIRNALVHLPAVVFGELVDREKFIGQPTPRFFSTYSLDFDFDLDADRPVELLKFLSSAWPNDPESIDAMQEWFGYNLSPDTGQQKIGLCIGPPRSGRGTIGRLLRSLVGPENVAGLRLAALATNFGLEPLICKPLAIVGDARISGRVDTAAIVESLLSISGEDTMTIDRKHRSSWTGKLPTRLMLFSNELPRLPDQSGALASRFLVWKFTESFLGREDHGLDARLAAELPSILNWAIEGWKRLRDRGYFIQPTSGAELIDQVRDISSPVGVFVRERCNLDPAYQVDIPELFGEWRSWCDSKNRPAGDEATFGRNLRAVVPKLETKQRRGGSGSRVRCFAGIGLKP
jgi:P4 family phage/plasmid primase-like protien